jgi:hypothetical protein
LRSKVSDGGLHAPQKQAHAQQTYYTADLHHRGVVSLTPVP